MGDPLPDGIDIRQIFGSPTLEGLWGLKPITTNEPYLCGVAAVCTIMGHLGKPVSIATATDALNTSRQQGVCWKEIQRFICSKRVRCSATKETPATAVRDALVPPSASATSVPPTR